MTEFGEWMDRYDAQKDDPAVADPGTPAAAIDDPEAMARAGAIMAPLYARWAGRAGIPLDDVVAEADQRMTTVTQIVVGRAVRHGVLDVGEIRAALRECWMDGLFAGVLWEQDRHLPDLDVTA